MSLIKYEIFCKTVETGSFTKAAQQLNVTQSAVSHAISSLENEFGFLLLTRNKNGIALTSNGEHLLHLMQEILNKNESLKQEVAAINGLETGVINIGLFPSITVQWLPGIIKQFQTQHPMISINFYEGIYDEIHNWIQDGTVDFGFMTATSARAFDFIPLKNDDIVCILSKEHRLHNLKKISFDQIENESLIVAKWGVDDEIRKLFKKNQTIPKVKYEVAEGPAIINMVKYNLGISLLPEMLVTLYSDHICIKKMVPNVYRTIGIAGISLKSISPASKKFILLTQSWLSNHCLSEH